MYGGHIYTTVGETAKYTVDNLRNWDGHVHGIRIYPVVEEMAVYTVDLFTTIGEMVVYTMDTFTQL